MGKGSSKEKQIIEVDKMESQKYFNELKSYGSIISKDMINEINKLDYKEKQKKVDKMKKLKGKIEKLNTTGLTKSKKSWDSNVTKLEKEIHTLFEDGSQKYKKFTNSFLKELKAKKHPTKVESIWDESNKIIPGTFYSIIKSILQDYYECKKESKTIPDNDTSSVRSDSSKSQKASRQKSNLTLTLCLSVSIK